MAGAVATNPPYGSLRCFRYPSCVSFLQVPLDPWRKTPRISCIVKFVEINSTIFCALRSLSPTLQRVKAYQQCWSRRWQGSGVAPGTELANGYRGIVVDAHTVN